MSTKTRRLGSKNLMQKIETFIPSPVSARRYSKSNGSSIQGKPKPIPVIVVTDIGTDIDDTLALFVLLGSMDAVKIIAFVTSINNGLERGAVVRGYLRLLAVADEKIEILPSVDALTPECFVPESFPTAKEAALGDISETPRRIVELCKEHEETGVYLFGIGSLTPLAEAIRLDQKENGFMRKSVKRVYLQGNCYVSSGEEKSSDPVKFSSQNTRILPNPLAYNFSSDIDAATTVVDYFQDFVPFTFLGKFAAYRIPLLKGEFTKWTNQLIKTWKKTLKHSKGVRVPNPPDLILTTKRQMKRFRAGNPTKFDSIFDVPTNLSEKELQEFGWFDSLPNDFVCAHPYDPLLAVKMVEDIRKAQLKEGFCIDEDVSDNMDLSRNLFEEYYALNKSGHVHTIIGNIPTRHSIDDISFVRNTLEKHITAGVQYHGDSIWLQ